MKSNFDFLASEWNAIYERAKRAEEFAFPDTRAAYVFARMTLELTIKLIYEKDYDLELDNKSTLDALIRDEDFSQKLGRALRGKILEIKFDGNNAVHNSNLKNSNPIIILKNLFEFTKWFNNRYSDYDDIVVSLFDESILSKKKTKELSHEELNELEKKLKAENQKEVEIFQQKIRALESEIANHLTRIREQEQKLFDYEKMISNSKDITQEYSELQTSNKKNENYYSFQIQEVGLTEQKGLIWGRVFINFVFNNEQYFAVKHFAPDENGKVKEQKLIAKGKYQEHELYKIFDKQYNNLNFRDVLKGKYDSLELVIHYDKKRFGTPSLLFEKLHLDLKKQFAFKLGDKEYIENGHYRIDNIDYMSIWTFKNNFETNSENTTEQNFSDANKIIPLNSDYYRSKPDYGYFNEIKIYPVRTLKKFYHLE